MSSSEDWARLYSNIKKASDKELLHPLNSLMKIDPEEMENNANNQIGPYTMAVLQEVLRRNKKRIENEEIQISGYSDEQLYRDAICSFKKYMAEQENLLKGEKVKHDPNDVALLMDIVGSCNACKKHTTAKLVAYYSGEILIRCHACKTANKFTPDNKSYTDAKTFAPFANDEDDEK